MQLRKDSLLQFTHSLFSLLYWIYINGFFNYFDCTINSIHLLCWFSNIKSKIYLSVSIFPELKNKKVLSKSLAIPGCAELQGVTILGCCDFSKTNQPTNQDKTQWRVRWIESCEVGSGKQGWKHGHSCWHPANHLESTKKTIAVAEVANSSVHRWHMSMYVNEGQFVSWKIEISSALSYFHFS